MKFAAVFAVAAFVAAFAGGALQRSDGPGSQPGLALAHSAAVLLIVAAVVFVIALVRRWWFMRAFIMASDGVSTKPITGPYRTRAVAHRHLSSVRAQLDPDGAYQWDVLVTAEPLLAMANNRVR